MSKRRYYVLGILIVLAFIFFPAFSQMQVLKSKIRQDHEQIRYLESENVRLKREKQRLESDPVYLEKVAREKLGIVKEGEVIYRVEKVPER